MLEETSGAIAESESKTEETRNFIKRVRRITRRKYIPEERVRIVPEGFRHGVPIRDLCRREGIRPNAYYAWLRDFMEAGKTRLARDTVRYATRAEVKGFVAGKEYHRKTKRPNEMWATYCSYLRVIDWGYYYLVTPMKWL